MGAEEFLIKLGISIIIAKGFGAEQKLQENKRY